MSYLSNNIGLYGKCIIAAFVAAGTTAITGLADGHLTGLEWIAVIAAFVVALGAVWRIPNEPVGVQKYGKAITSAVVAGLGSLGAALAAGPLTQSSYITIAIAVLAGAGLVIPISNAVTSSTGSDVVNTDDSNDGEDAQAVPTPAPDSNAVIVLDDAEAHPDNHLS